MGGRGLGEGKGREREEKGEGRGPAPQVFWRRSGRVVLRCEMVRGTAGMRMRAGSTASQRTSSPKSCPT